MHGAEESMLRRQFPCLSCMQTVVGLHVVVFEVQVRKAQPFQSTSLQLRSGQQGDSRLHSYIVILFISLLTICLFIFEYISLTESTSIMAASTVATEDEKARAATPTDFQAVLDIEPHGYLGFDYLPATYSSLVEGPGVKGYVYEKNGAVVSVFEGCFWWEQHAKCIWGMDLPGQQLYTLPRWDRSCRSNLLSHPVKILCHQSNQF